MGVNGFEDYWLAGARFLFKRSGGNVWVDFGVLQSAAPSFTIDKVELEDPHSGVKVIADSVVTKIDETYDITTSNMNMQNLSLAFLGSTPAVFAQALGQVDDVVHVGNDLGLIKITDGGGANIFSLSRIVSIAETDASYTALSCTDIDASTGIVQTTTDPGFTGGEVFRIQYDDGSVTLADPLNAGTYTTDVASTGAGDPYSIQLNAESTARLNSSESPAANVLLEHDAGTPENLLQYAVDWEEPAFGLDKGFANVLDAAPATVPKVAGILDGLDYDITYVTAAVTSGIRSFIPQTSSEVKGEGILYISRSNFGEITTREMPSISISPSSLDINATDFSSMVLQVKVLTSTTDGRVLQFKGDVPTFS